MKFRDIYAVQEHIKGLSALHELTPEVYAPPGGAADVVVEELFNDKKGRNKVNQLRKFFGALKRIQTDLIRAKPTDSLPIDKVYQLMPELAYARGRELISGEFYDLMLECLDKSKMKQVRDFERLVEFLQAILAYHKMRTACGGEKRGTKISR